MSSFSYNKVTPILLKCLRGENAAPVSTTIAISTTSQATTIHIPQMGAIHTPS